MPTFMLRGDTVDAVQFVGDTGGIAAVARFCGDRGFRLTPPLGGGGLVAEFRPAPNTPWQPLAPGAWLVRLPDGTVAAAPATFGAVFAALFEEVHP